MRSSSRGIMRCLGGAVLCVTWISLSPVAGGGEFQTLLKPIPEDANALVAIDVERMFNSALAKAENWRQKYADVYAATPLVLPPNAEKFLLASEMDIEFMQPAWEIASMFLTDNPSTQEIVELTGGVTDSFFGTDAVWTGQQTCVARFDPNVYAAFFPATRQSAARWIRKTLGVGSTQLSPYLMQTVGEAENSPAQVVMAFDLEHIVHGEEIRAAVDRSELLGDLDKDQVTQLFTTLRGVTMGVRVSDKITGKVSIDFAEDTAILADVAKPLILAMLSGAGAMLDEFENWSGKADAKRLVLQGNLTDAGMRRLLSLMGLHSPLVRHGDPQSPDPAPAPGSQESKPQTNDRPDEPRSLDSPRAPEPPPVQDRGEIGDPAATSVSEATMGRATADYFRSVKRQTSDLLQRDPKSIADVALWIDSATRKINRLPTRNVDPEMVAFGQEVTAGMQQAISVAQDAKPNALEKASEWTPKGTVTAGNMPAPMPTVAGIGRYMGRRRPYYGGGIGAYPRIGGFRTVGGYGGYNWRRPFAVANVDIESVAHGPKYIANQEYEKSMKDVKSVLDWIRQETDRIEQLMTDRYGRAFSPLAR